MRALLSFEHQNTSEPLKQRAGAHTHTHTQAHTDERGNQNGNDDSTLGNRVCLHNFAPLLCAAAASGEAQRTSAVRALRQCESEKSQRSREAMKLGTLACDQTISPEPERARPYAHVGRRAGTCECALFCVESPTVGAPHRTRGASHAFSKASANAHTQLRA